MLNLMHRLISTEQIDIHVPERETRHNKAPLIKSCVPINNIVAKSPAFGAREIWNNLSPDFRSIVDHEHVNPFTANYPSMEVIITKILS